MQQIFNENSPSKIRAILSNFDFSYDSLKLIRPAIKRNNGGSSTPSGNSPSDAIINSFLTEYHRFAAEAVTPVSDKIAALVEFVHSVEKLLDHSDPQLALEAAMLIVETGSPAPYPLLLRQIETLTTSQKRSLLYDIDENSPDEALPLLRTLLRDASSSIRELAASAAFENSANERFLSSPFEELVSPASPLRPTEVFNYELSNMLENTTGKSIAGKWARQILDADYSSDTMRAFALSILAQAWTPADSDRALPLIASDNLYIRRAAWYAIAKNDTQGFTSDLKLVMAESSELVRAVIPAAYASHSFEWVNYFDSNQFATSDEGNSRNRLEAPVLESLHRLTRDASAKISIEAFFSLMSNSEEIDIDRFMSAVGKLPDRDAIGERIADYLSDNYSRLDKSPEKGLQRLLQFLDYHDSDYEKERIYKHFNASPDKETINVSLNEIAPGKKENDTAATPATSNLPDAPPPPDTPLAAPPEVVRLVYFFKPGCDVCETVSDDLHKLSEKHKIQVDRYDIETVEAKLFNETLCERFDVPENIRLVAPAIFTTAGFSIKTDATRQKIERLIRDSFEMPADETWHVMQEAQLAAAENVIVERFSSLRLGVIISAGLLDGINPCAFATIIFFLSYLAVAGRNSRQILQVGIAFIFGVFIAYFLLGLGLMQIAVKIQQYQWISRSVNYLMAALAIVIMIICIKDGILCLRGRLADTSLQLPAFLKKRINSVIRKGARHSRFVIAAFVVGLIISALELACTGQVYLPTIMFAIQSGQSNAIAYLAIFNIAFVVPLIIIFLLAFFGMKSDALIRFQAKHSAAVKFATAILFFALAAFLIFGDKLLNPPSSAPAPSVEIIEST